MMLKRVDEGEKHCSRGAGQGVGVGVRPPRRRRCVCDREREKKNPSRGASTGERSEWTRGLDQGYGAGKGGDFGQGRIIAMTGMRLRRDKDAGREAGPPGGENDGAGGVAGGEARRRGRREAGARGLARCGGAGWPPRPGPAPAHLASCAGPRSAARAPTAPGEAAAGTGGARTPAARAAR